MYPGTGIAEDGSGGVCPKPSGGVIAGYNGRSCRAETRAQGGGELFTVLDLHPVVGGGRVTFWETTI